MQVPTSNLSGKLTSGFFGETVHPVARYAQAGDLPHLQRRVSQENVNLQDQRGHTLLSLACSADQLEAVKYLLSIGADANLAGEDGITPLMAAARAGNLEMVKTLLEAGAELDARTPGGLTAEGFAQTFRQEEVESHLASLATERLNHL